MRLRELRLEDAPLMLEWMHDDDVVHALQADFASKTLEDCKGFIERSWNGKDALHLAVVAEDDQYMGTVSLKYIDQVHQDAEFAITVRKAAMGKGYAQYAMREIIRLAFEEKRLACVYWCVSTHNVRAVRFYNKSGYETTHDIRREVIERYRHIGSLVWYCVRG